MQNTEQHCVQRTPVGIFICLPVSIYLCLHTREKEKKHKKTTFSNNTEASDGHSQCQVAPIPGKEGKFELWHILIQSASCIKNKL